MRTLFKAPNLPHNNPHMDLKGELIGRLAQLQNLVSRPELNGAYVLITGYFPTKDRFSVKELPHANADAESILVKEESLQLSTANYFSMVYPDPPEVNLNDLKSILEETRSGTVQRIANLRRSDCPYIVQRESNRDEDDELCNYLVQQERHCTDEVRGHRDKGL